MKTKLRRMSKRTLALILCFLMMISALGLGSLITAYADNSVTFYIYPADLWSDYASYTIKANVNIGDNNTWRTFDFSDTGKTINGKVVYTVTITEKYGGVDTLQIQKYQGSTWKDQKVPYSAWTTSNTFSGKIYNGSTWVTLPAYDPDDFVVAGEIASNGWDNTTDVMTLSSSTYTKTYSSKAAGNYTFAVVKKGDWNTSYRWAAKGTLTDNGCGSWADANDGDHNIKLTLTQAADVEITLNSSKKVDVKLTPLSHNVTRTAPSNGTLYVSTSSTVGTGTTATVAEGSTYYIKATPSTGYKLTALTVTPSGGSAVSVIGSNSGATSAVTVSRTMGTADENVAATFAKQTYTVSYNKGSYGSGTNTSDTKTYGEALTLKGAIFTRTGYTQTGWNTNSSGSGGTHYNLSASYTANAGTTLYPEWTANSYSITYKDQGGSAFSGTHESGYPTTHTYGTATSLKTASKDGYTFGGWFTTSACTGSAVTSLGATSYTANITLYAKWTIKTYTITYNKGANGTGTIASGTKTHGVDFTLSSSTFTRADYTQTGWSTTDGGAKAYELGGTYTANSNITLYPFWTLSASPQLASISNVTGKTVNDTSFNATTTINNSQYASGTLTVTASSNSTSIITVGTVNKSGNNVTIPLTVKGPGTATITVTLKDGSTTVDTKIFTVTVDAPTFTITAATVYASTKNKDLTVTKSPTPSSTTWASNKTSYVTVNSSGQVTTVAIPTSDQTVTITATATYACGYSTSFTGTVTLKAPTLTITSTKTSGYINDTATASVSNAANPSLTTNTLSAYNWTSSDPSVVSVSSATAASPTLTFLKNGTATISLEVTYKNTLLKKTSNSVTITVNPPTVTMSGKTVAKGDSVTFSATTANPSSGLTITYSLQSAVSGVSITSAGVASVTSSCSASSATVVATVKNAAGDVVATKTATLTIQAPSVTIADIANNSTQNLTVGTNITNKTVSNNFSGTYTVTSSKTSVATATITSGKLTVTSVAKGKTTITVTATKGSITASRTFTVLVAAAASTDVVVYLQDFTYNNNDGWGAAYIHTWETDGGAAISDRAQMTKIGVNSSGRSVYAYKFTAAQWAKVKHIVFLKTNADSAWNDQWSHTEDKFNGTHGTTTAFQLRSDSNGSARKLDTSTISISIPQISADDIDDLPINTSTSLYADVLNSTTPSKFTWSIEDTSIATVANADTGTTDHNSITGVYPGTTTITIKAYAALPTGWTPLTDGTADAFLADSTTASVTVTATPKTVSWGNKLSTDNGSTFVTTNASSAGTVSVSPTMSNGGSVAHGTQITFTATTNSGYRFAGWQVNGTNTITTTTSKTITVTANTTVYALYYKTYTVTLSVGTGIQTGSGYRKYKVGSGGTYANYSSAVTVNQGAEVYFQIAYKNGYEYNSVTNASVVTNYTEFKTSAISANTTVTISAKKITYTLTGKVSPTGHGAVKFYSDSNCTNQITTAQINDAIYARFEPSDAYVLQSFTKNSSSASFGTRSGNVIPVTMGYMNLTVTANVILQYSVTYYIDMHSANVSSLTAKVTDSGGTVLTDSDGEDCEGTFTRQGSSTVYAATINTPLTQSGSTYNTLYFTITFNGSSYQKELNNAQITSMVNNSEQAIWLEAMSDSPQDLSIVYSTNQTPTVESGYQRIYLKKPYSWQNTTEGQKWNNIGVYYWGDNPTDIGWTNSIKMNYLGYDTSSGHHYYYADIPTTIHDTSDDQDYAVKNIIFQGWGSNESISQNSHVVAQTENIMNFTKNYFTLENTNNVITGVPAESNALVPGYTRYASSVTAQVGETETINIKPTTSNTVTFSSNGSQYASVDSNGNITPHAKGVATITITVYGTVGDLVRSHESTAKDYRKYYVNVYVKDPSVTSGFDIMSFSTRTSTITIPTVSGSQPGYFDSAPSVAVTGTPNAPTAGYPNSAIVSPSDNAVTGSGISGTKYKTYTVKYAAPSTFSGYTGITVTAAEIVSKSIHYNDEARYGFKQWKKGTTVQSYTVTKSVTDGVETAITKNVVLDGSTFSEEFEQYTYVDVTFNFDYYEYQTLRTVQKKDAENNPIPILDGSGNPTGQYETEQKNFYYYDPEWIGNDDSRAKADAENTPQTGLVHYVHKTYTVTDFEVRNKTSAAISDPGYDKSLLVGDTADAIEDMPTNNYYDYTLNTSTIKTITKNGDYKATIKVELLHNPRTYKVYCRNTTTTTSENEGIQTNTNKNSPNYDTNNFYYQEYVNLTNGESRNWILTNSDNSYTGPTMYTGKAYKFRVTGDTYIKTQTAPELTGDDFNRSRVTHTGQEINHEARSATDSTIVPKLTNNFYIADFFDPEKVLDPNSDPSGNGNLITYDDVAFVGGGVVYYQIKDGVPAQKAVDGGYVNGDSGSQNYGLANADAIKDFIKEKIEAGLNNSTIVPNDIEGDDDRMAIAYGNEYKAQKDSDTDLFYRYLPYEVYDRNDPIAPNPYGTLKTETVDGVTTYTLATNRQSNAYRYSNALKAYQYIYASKQENKITNEGKDMCLYAYYIYSYTAYDSDTGIPYTKYNVVLSDQPANASTYFNSNS
jgi:uncharacterized repeat protein (TIGR02543 family)